jgi:hypothetical protein
MKKYSLFFLLGFICAAPILAFAQATISPTIPGMTSAVTTSTSPGAFVAGFYNFALMIGGVLAFGAIVYGGVLYAASVGNPSKQSEGREWNKSALLGLLLLAGAYLILNTINPNLVNLSLPTLQSINIQVPATAAIYGAGTSQSACSNVTCPAGSSPVNSQVYSGGGAQCSCQTPDTGSGPKVVCGGQSSGSCPNDSNGNPQTCTQTQTNPVVYGCQSSASFTCGNMSLGGGGSCPSGLACVPKGTNANGTPISWTCGN